MTILETWKKAQLAEINHHSYETDIASPNLSRYKFYADTYKKYLHIDNDLTGKTILDIGGGPLSMLLWCQKFLKAWVIDPLPMPEIIANRYKNYNIHLISCPAEEVNFPKTNEIWVYNCLQHVMNPDLIIKKALDSCSTIKIFEPINYETNIEHIHKFTYEYFKNKFNGGSLYVGGSIKQFHTADCFYGEFKKGKT